MKKVLMLATAALLITGVSFANDDKKRGKGKKCSKKEKSGCKEKDKNNKTAIV